MIEPSAAPTNSVGVKTPPGAPDPLLLALAGMATLLAATTHAPIMAALMVFEMTGEYALLPGILLSCVIATTVSRGLQPVSVYHSAPPPKREA